MQGIVLCICSLNHRSAWRIRMCFYRLNDVRGPIALACHFPESGPIVCRASKTHPLIEQYVYLLLMQQIVSTP